MRCARSKRASRRRRLLNKGDTVIAVKGDLKGLRCKIIDILSNPSGRPTDLEVLIMPVEREMPEPIKYRATSLVKSFDEGDHVKVRRIHLNAP